MALISLRLELFPPTIENRGLFRETFFPDSAYLWGSVAINVRAPNRDRAMKPCKTCETSIR